MPAYRSRRRLSQTLSPTDGHGHHDSDWETLAFWRGRLADCCLTLERVDVCQHGKRGMGRSWSPEVASPVCPPSQPPGVYRSP